MTKVFTDAPVYLGWRGDYARATDFDGRVLIRAIDPLDKKAVTIAMTPEQARALAQGIIAAAKDAESER